MSDAIKLEAEKLSKHLSEYESLSAEASETVDTGAVAHLPGVQLARDHAMVELAYRARRLVTLLGVNS